VNARVIYIGAFVLAFLLVTGGVYYLNTKYNNIFAFDFSPAKEEPAQKKDAGKDKKEEKPKEKKEEKKTEPEKQEQNQQAVQQPQEDQTAIAPVFLPQEPSASNLKPLTAVEQKKDNNAKPDENKALLDSINHLNKKLKELMAKKDVAKAKESERQAIADSLKKIEMAVLAERQDSTYKSWLKKTVILYEAMDAKKAAKIILTYSDNIAKDIVYSMKKKKAAEILAQLNPETVNRITRVK
jgi:flagellar motility protein MotE (MotC chaperone)